MQKRPIFFVWGEGETHRVIIPDGFRLVVLKRDESPSPVPVELMPPGDYEFKPEILPGGSWPMALWTCSASLIPAIEALPPEKVNAIFDAAAPSTTGHPS